MLPLTAAPPCSGQTTDERPVRRIELTVGAGMLGGAGLGSRDANLRANDPVQRPFRLFTTDSEFARARQFHVRAGLALNRRLGVEGGLTWSRPDLRTAVTADAEGAPPITIAEQVDQYFIDAGVVFLIDELRMGARIVPFIVAGGGYLRQLHEGLTVVEQGQVYHLGGGLKYWLLTRRSGVIHGAGLRGDARAYVMRGGVSFGGGPRPHMAISGSAFVTF
jgi:hypothetical protein